MTATSVKTFYSTNGNAPVLSGSGNGSLISVLDACLKDGFNLKTIDTLVVSGGVATAVVSAGHGYSLYQVVTIAGATPSTLNGDWRITSMTATSFKFAATGIGDVTATGSINCKLTPLGWAKPFSGTNLAAYQSTSPQSTGMYLRVDDTGSTARIARAWGCETMTDINTFTGQFPTPTQAPGGFYWARSDTLDATSRAWMLFGDERMFYLWVAPRLSVSSTNGAVFVFGDLIPQASSDPYLCYISGALGDITGTTSDNASCMGYIFGSGGYFARSYTQLGGSISALRCGPYGLAASYSGGNNYSGGSLFVTPLNPTDNALIIVPVFGFEQVTNRCLRGQFPGFYHTPGSLVNSVLVHLDIYSNLDSMPGKTLLGFRVSAAAAGAGVNNSGYAFVDLIGPWR